MLGPQLLAGSVPFAAASPAAYLLALPLFREALLPALLTMDAHDVIVVKLSSHGRVHDCWNEPPVAGQDRTAGAA